MFIKNLGIIYLSSYEPFVPENSGLLLASLLLALLIYKFKKYKNYIIAQHVRDGVSLQTPGYNHHVQTTNSSSNMQLSIAGHILFLYIKMYTGQFHTENIGFKTTFCKENKFLIIKIKNK